MISNYGGALVEEFIDGPEYSVLVSSNINNEKDPITYTPVICLLPTDCNWKTFDFKWHSSKNPFSKLEDPALIKDLQDMSKKMFVAMQMEGFC